MSNINILIAYGVVAVCLLSFLYYQLNKKDND